METFEKTETDISFTVEDVQDEAKERIGRELTKEEILIANDNLQMGILTSIHDVYGTIFNEMITR